MSEGASVGRVQGALRRRRVSVSSLPPLATRETADDLGVDVAIAQPFSVQKDPAALAVVCARTRVQYGVLINTSVQHKAHPRHERESVCAGWPP